MIKMNEILIAVQPISDVVEGAQIDYEKPNSWGKIDSCYNCGSTLFYIVITSVPDTELASDTHRYCAVCGLDNGGWFDDPLDEMTFPDCSEEKRLLRINDD